MALAERILAEEFGDIVDHFTYVLASDGDLMEGISQEAIALAGHLKLSKLIVFFDDNGITIDGKLSLADSTDQVARFKASNWNASRIDGHDPAAIEQALEAARKSDKPTMIACRTTIGFGAPHKAGTAEAHGSALGTEEIKGAREKLGWNYSPFEIPADILGEWRKAGARSADTRKKWKERVKALPADKRAEFERRMAGKLPAALASAVRQVKENAAAKPQEIATRKASELALESLIAAVPEMIGGSADLTGSNNTKTKAMAVIGPGQFKGRFMHWGIREHGMAAGMNGMSLHGGIIPYSGTFLVFSDYCRPSLRLAALMEQRVIHVMTHDSIGLGEDGPTHQPVEHLAALRAIPNLHLFRPADLMETAECWQLALEYTGGPSVLALTRQNLPAVRTAFEEANKCARGAYELAPAKGKAQVSLFASGSEVSLCVVAKNELEKQGIATRVVSVPCLDLFLAQEESYRAAIVGDAAIKIAVEAAIRLGWDAVIGSGTFIGMSGFGASAPYKDLYRHFGITTEAIVAAAFAALGDKRELPRKERA
jgi:transketolase